MRIQKNKKIWKSPCFDLPNDRLTHKNGIYKGHNVSIWIPAHTHLNDIVSSNFSSFYDLRLVKIILIHHIIALLLYIKGTSLLLYKSFPTNPLGQLLGTDETLQLDL